MDTWAWFFIVIATTSPHDGWSSQMITIQMPDKATCMQLRDDSMIVASSLSRENRIDFVEVLETIDNTLCVHAEIKVIHEWRPPKF